VGKDETASETTENRPSYAEAKKIMLLHTYGCLPGLPEGIEFLFSSFKGDYMGYLSMISFLEGRHITARYAWA